MSDDDYDGYFEDDSEGHGDDDDDGVEVKQALCATKLLLLILTHCLQGSTSQGCPLFLVNVEKFHKWSPSGLFNLGDSWCDQRSKNSKVSNSYPGPVALSPNITETL